MFLIIPLMAVAAAPDISVLVNEGEPPLRLASDGTTTAGWIVGLLFKGEACEKVALMRHDGLLLRPSSVVLPGSYRLLACAAPPVHIHLAPPPPMAAKQSIPPPPISAAAAAAAVVLKPQPVPQARASSSSPLVQTPPPPPTPVVVAAIAGRNEWTDAEEALLIKIAREQSSVHVDYAKMLLRFPGRTQSSLRHKFRRVYDGLARKAAPSPSPSPAQQQQQQVPVVKRRRGRPPKNFSALLRATPSIEPPTTSPRRSSSSNAPWTAAEEHELSRLQERHGDTRTLDWATLSASKFPGRSASALRNKWLRSIADEEDSNSNSSSGNGREEVDAPTQQVKLGTDDVTPTLG